MQAYIEAQAKSVVDVRESKLRYGGNLYNFTESVFFKQTLNQLFSSNGSYLTEKSGFLYQRHSPFVESGLL